MRLLVDECTGPSVAATLRRLGHDVFSAYDQSRGQSDEWLLEKAVAEDRIVITNDRDFGLMIFRGKKPHRGVVYLRLKDERLASKLTVLEKLLQDHGPRLPGAFVVASETQVRFARN